MNLLSKEAILQAQDLVTKDVVVSAWGGTVRLRMLTAAERTNLEAQLADGLAWAKFKAKLISLAAVDEEGKRLFSDEDIDALTSKSGTVIDLLFVEANDLNKMSSLDTDNAEKESAAAQADGSTSSSPGDLDTPTQT